MKNKLKILLTALTAGIIFCSCGQGVVEIGQNTYEPKIVIEGYLYPGQPVRNIRITRNIPLNTASDPTSIVITNADVKLTDLQTNKNYQLTFNVQKFSYEYSGNDLRIDYGNSYKLTVNAAIDGKSLSASSVTNVPKSGFKINPVLSELQPLYYRERDGNGNVKNFSITFSPSTGTNFYAFSIAALDASDSTFIYNNAYVNVSHDDVTKNLDGYRYQLIWLQDINSFGAEIKYDLDWIHFWFYGKYRIIVYAGDDNYKNFVLTYKNVQEFDGNFHEPQMNMQGDGIGIFGSVIADTVYVSVKK